MYWCIHHNSMSGSTESAESVGSRLPTELCSVQRVVLKKQFGLNWIKVGVTVVVSAF